jgi:hypothetical protein
LEDERSEFDDLIEDLDELFNIRKIGTFDDVPDTPGGDGFWDGTDCDEDGDKWLIPFDCPPEMLSGDREHGWIEDKKTVKKPKRNQRGWFDGE